MNHGSADLSGCLRETCEHCPWTRLSTCPIKPFHCPADQSALFLATVAGDFGILMPPPWVAFPLVHTQLSIFFNCSLMALASLPWCLFLCPASWIPWLVDLKSDLLIDHSKGKISLLLRKLLNEKVR